MSLEVPTPTGAEAAPSTPLEAANAAAVTASSSEAVTAAPSSGSFNNVWRPRPSGAGFTTGAAAAASEAAGPLERPPAPPAPLEQPPAPADAETEATGAGSMTMDASMTAERGAAEAIGSDDKTAPSPNKVLAVACCKLIHDRNGNTAYVCRYPGCEKSYASRDAVRSP